MKEISQIPEFLDLLFSPTFKKSVTQALNEFQMTKSHTEESEPYCDIDEASRITHLEKSTIYVKCSRNEIPYYKRGKRLYFKKSELKEWISNGRYNEKSKRQEFAADYFKKQRGGRL